MYGVFVICKIKPGRGEDFRVAALGDRAGTRTEPGNLRFDIMQPPTPVAAGQPEVFYLFELYRSEEAFAEHQKTPHFYRFREETVDLMAEPREGLRYVPLHTDPWE